jgi:hypothetical protein
MRKRGPRVMFNQDLAVFWLILLCSLLTIVLV